MKNQVNQVSKTENNGLKIKIKVNSMRHTENGNSYWSNDGAYSKELSELYDKLVPISGNAQTVHGELVRAVSRLGYEYYNNGNCNACDPYYADPEYDVDDNGEEYCINDGEIKRIDINGYYEDMLDFIYTYSDVEGLTTTQQVEEAIEGVCYVIKQAVNYETCGGYFQESFEKRYNELTDLVMYVVLNTEDMPNPEYKEEK